MKLIKQRIDYVEISKNFNPFFKLGHRNLEFFILLIKHQYCLDCFDNNFKKRTLIIKIKRNRTQNEMFNKRNIELSTSVIKICNLFNVPEVLNVYMNEIYKKLTTIK